MARCGSGGLAAGLGAHTGIALPPIATFGTEAQKQRYLVPGLRGELIAALAITEPGAGSDVAGDPHPCPPRRRRLARQRLQDVHHRRGPRRHARHRGEDRTAGDSGPRAPARHLVPDRRTRPGGQRQRRCASSAGTPPTPPRSGSTTCSCPSENLLGAEHQGFYLIMANFQWERLLMALGAVGAMQVVLRADAGLRLRSRGPALPAGDPPPDGRDRARARGRARCHLRRAAPPRGRRGRGARGDDRQAAHPAQRLRRHRRLRADPRRSTPRRSSSGRCATRGWARSAAGPTRS